MFNEIVYSILAIVVFTFFIIWVVQSVRKCKIENSQLNISEETKTKNKKIKNIKIILGFVVLFFISIQMEFIKEQNLADIDFIEVLSIFSAIILIGLIVFFVLKYKKDKSSGNFSEEELKKKQNLSILICIAVYLILMGIVQILKPVIENKQEQVKLEQIENEKKQEVAAEQKYRQTLADNLMVSLDFLNDIEIAFGYCGLGEIQSVKFMGDFILEDGSTKETIFNVFLKERNENGDQISLVLHNGNIIHLIQLNGKELYKDGKLLETAKDYFRLTFNEKSTAKYNFEEYIRASLGSIGDYPKFPKYLDNPEASDNTYIWGCDSDGIEIVVGWVEFPNVWGVIYKNPFKVYINKKTDRFTVEMLE